MEQILSGRISDLQKKQADLKHGEKKRANAVKDTDISELEHLAISAKYHMPLEEKFPKYFLKRFGDKYSRAAHTTLEFITPFKSIVDFCKWKAIPNKKTWDGEVIDAVTEKHIGNIVSIICILGFKGVTDTNPVSLPTDPASMKSTMSSLVSKISSFIPAAEAENIIKDSSWKNLIERISKYMTTIANVSYEYNARTNILKQTIDSRWEIIDDKYVKPLETNYDPDARQKYINIHLGSDDTHLEEMASQLNLSDVFGMEIKTTTHDIDHIDKMIPEHMNDPKNADFMAELMLDIVESQSESRKGGVDIDENGINWS